MLYQGDTPKALTYGVIGKLVDGIANYRRRMRSWIIRGPQVDALWKMFASSEPSRTDKETYAHYGMIPKVVEWTGVQGYTDTEEFSNTIKNLDWWVGFSLHEKVMRRNQLRTPLIRAEQMGERIEHHRDELALGVLTDAAPGYLGYDGKALFATDHRKGSSTQSNLPTAAALSMTKFQEAFTVMEKLKDPLDVEEVGAIPNLLLCGVDLRFTAWDIVINSLKITTAGSGEAAAIQNPIITYGMDLVIVPHTIPADSWFLFDTTHGEAKPVIFQEEKMPELRTNADDPNDVERRRKGEVVYQMDASYNVGIGEYLYAVRGK